METSTILILITVGFIIILITTIMSVYSWWSLWFQTLVAGAPVNPFRVALMRMRQIDPRLILEAKIKAANSGVKIRTYRLEEHVLAGGDVMIIVNAKIKAFQSGVDVDIDFIQSHQLAGGSVDLIVDSLILAEKADLIIPIQKLAAHDLTEGNVKKVVSAMITARKADIPLEFDRAAAIDLAGRDILEAVQMRVQPKVIKTDRVTAIAQDGIELTATARVTVQMDLDHLVGGAGEDTVLARVGQGIVSAIGSAKTHKEILQNPQSISKKIWTEDLSKNTAFFILSVDVADIDVGQNIGARHEVQRAEAETKIAQAQAEKKEQEMRVRILEMRAKLLEAEASVPQAMSSALEQGKLGVMDYYRMKNMRADIEMRHSFAQSGRRQESDDGEESEES